MDALLPTTVHGLKPANHYMLDIETFGLDVDSVVTEFAIVKFNSFVDFNRKYFSSSNPVLFNDFHRMIHIKGKLDVGLQVRSGRKISADTVVFHQKHWHKDEFAEIMWPSPQTIMHEYQGQIIEFFKTNGSFYKDILLPVNLWMRGQDFDLPIIRSLLGKENIPPQWHYSCGRDVRTLLSLVPEIPAVLHAPLREYHHKHTAYGDCLVQILDVQLAMFYLMNKLNSWESLFPEEG
jgi:3' exoribonuclease, RNase T-like